MKLKIEMKKDKAKKQIGRPTKYKKSFNKQVYKLCLLGATDKEIASFFEVNEDTINEWKKKHPSFLESIKKGKINADAIIASSLFKKAKGYTREEVKIFQHDGSPLIVPFKAYYPPDTAAINIWLKNRRGGINPEEGQKWADKQEFDHTARIEKNIDQLSDEQADLILQQLSKKALENL